MSIGNNDIQTTCFHCGDACSEGEISTEEKSFCCIGCKTVYHILQKNDLEQYYKIESNAGVQQRDTVPSKYDFLDDEKIQDELILFKDESKSSVQFYLPQIHCSACIWLLERLYKFESAILESKVNFLKKELTLVYNHKEIDLKGIANLLQQIGYAPTISLEQVNPERKKKKVNRKLSYQIGLAGFAFGNIMLLSLPEYLGITQADEANLSRIFNWLNLLLATPVAIYSGQDYFRSAWYSLQQKRLNIDVPIALGISVLYLRSTYEIVSQSGSGYFDSLCGLLFFLLLGRLFQQKIYHRLSFERDYQSYFPIAVTQIMKGEKISIPLNNLKKGDRIIVRNGELIPVDALLLKGKAKIDNSFISGESKLIEKILGDKIYAGGKQVGESITLEVIKPLNQSRLTSLWNRYASMNKEKYESHFSKSTDQISEWFTPIILLIALLAGIYHFSAGWSAVIETVTAVLIVACPCALALAAPFTFGHAIRKAGRKGCYFRDASVIENMANINHIVFDKTGTLTLKLSSIVQYDGSPLNDYEKSVFYSLLSQSTHPLSRMVASEISAREELKFDHFEEIEGKGLLGIIDGKVYQAGSAKWLNYGKEFPDYSLVVLAFEKEILGVYKIVNSQRKNLKETIHKLSCHYQLSILSGDRLQSRDEFAKIFPSESHILFEQSPEEKVGFIEYQKEKGDAIAMVGDGLNDSAALQSAQLGISIAEDVHAFAPASDVILKGSSFGYLPSLFNFATYSKRIIRISFGISFLYNLVGLSFAVQGILSPVVAAILMPLSSITVVGFVSLASWMKPIKEV